MDNSGKQLKSKATKRARVKQRVQVIAENKRLILDALPASVLVTRPDGSVVYTNQCFNDQFGFRANQNIADFYGDPRERLNVLKSFRQHGYINNYELFARKADGSPMWVMFSTRPFEFEGEAVFLTSLIDITAHKQADEKRRQSEERYQNFVSHSLEAIYRTEFDHPIDISLPVEQQIDLIYEYAYIAECNQAMAEMRAMVSVDELIGSRLVDLHGGKDNPVNRAAFRKLIENNYHSIRDETIESRSDGNPICLLSNTVGMIENGHLVRLWSTVLDITERKRMDQTFRVRLRMSEFALSCSLGELLQKTLDEIELLTASQFGFFHAVEPDQKTLSLQSWSTNTLQNLCKVDGELLHNAIHQAGVWADCVRQRRAVIHNDYASLPASRRKGLSAGHVPIVRELVVPVFRGDRIVAVLGVGNKARDYDLEDAQTVSLLADLAWDLAERKQIEERLKQSEAQYRLLAENMTDTVWLVDMNFVTTYISPSVEKSRGYTLGEIQQMRFDEQLTPASSRLIAELLSVEMPKLMSNPAYSPTYNLELESYRKDGTTLWEENKINIIRDENGRAVSILGEARDITERKQVQDALRESEERYRRLTEAITDYIYTVRVERGRAVETRHGAGCVALTGYTPKEFVANPYLWYSMVQPEDRQLVKDQIRRLMAGQNVPVIEHRITRKDGSVRWIRDTLSPHFNQRQELVSYDGLIQDITERKQAQDALQRYAFIVNTAPEFMTLINRQHVYETVNDAYCHARGRSRAELIGHSLVEAWSETIYRDKLLPYLEQCFAGQTVRYEEAFLFSGDQMRYYQVGMYPYTATPTGPVTHVVVVTFDITERKEAEEKLAQQVKHLNALHTVEQAIVSSTDLNTILEIFIREVIEQLAVDASAVLLVDSQTQTLDFAAGQGFRTQALKFTRLNLGAGLAGRAAQERKIVYIANLAEMDDNSALAQAIAGENFVSYLSIPLLTKGNLLGVLEIFQRSELGPDLDWLRFLDTLADQAAIAIDNARLLEVTRQNLKEANALYHINQELIASTDSEDLMKDVVELLQKSFGYHYVQIFVADPKTGDFVMQAGSGEIGERLKNQGYHLAVGEGIVGLTAETGKPFFTNNVDDVISFVRPPLLLDTKSELAVPIKVGHQFLGLLDIHQTSPAYLTERDIQLVGAVADQLAVALQKAGLYANLQEALYQEQEARAQLIHSEKLAVAGRLLASVSHEMNNPIQAIQNALFLLKAEDGISAQGKQDLEIVLSETERMASMLQRLRTTYQPVSSEDFKPIQINDIIEDVCALVSTHLRHSRISFEFHADPGLPTIPGLGGQIRQVILNLLMNAVDAMAEGGNLTIGTQFLAESRDVLITVSDTGPGIELSIFPNIFEAFVTNKDGGTGLGLAISEEIVLKHHGRINAENNPKRGATFHVWLPVDERGEG